MYGGIGANDGDEVVGMGERRDCHCETEEISEGEIMASSIATVPLGIVTKAKSC